MCCVGLVRAYSKRSDLLNDLTVTLQSLSDAQARSLSEDLSHDRSVRESATLRPARGSRSLSDAQIQKLVRQFRSGTPKAKLAEQYGISLSTVKRLLKRHRDEG